MLKELSPQTNGEDFWAIIQAFTNIGGYRLEWQLLNTKWFLPQNRERIYLVGYLAEGSGGEVFPIRESSKQIDELQRQQANTCTLTTRYDAGGNGSYLIERKLNAQKVKIKSATKRGYEEATQGDSINFSVPNSKTRRGRVGKGVAQTLDTKCEQAVLLDQVRKLTPIECERLQGFPDNHTSIGNYDGQVKEVSDAQRYKMCGNAVTVDVVEAVGRNLIKIINKQ